MLGHGPGLFQCLWVRPSQGPSLSITFFNASDFFSTPLKLPTPVAMTWITLAPKIYIQITLLCNQIPSSFLLSLNPMALFFVLMGITSSQASLLYSYQHFFFLLTFLTRYLDAMKTTPPSISTFSFPCCSVIFLFQKTVSGLNPTQSFLGLYPVSWKLPGNWSFPPNFNQLTGHHSHQTLDY